MKSLLLVLLLLPQSDDRTLPKRTRCIETATKQPWAKQLKQIPSTVIDNGVLRAIPYTSYRSGDYEVNVYGDPAAPVCVEVGVYDASVKSAAAHQACLAYINALLDEEADRKALAGLKLQTGKAVRAGLTFEITPPDAPDAFNGWWISVYNEKLLDKARASDEEMKKITSTREDVKKKTAPTNDKGTTVEGASSGQWNGEDLGDARKRKDIEEDRQKVYKPAITKKDGKYVPDRSVDDTGFILFICANSDKHEDKEVIIKTCPACTKESTFFWESEKKCFVCFQCGADVDNAVVKCTDCGKVPKRVRTKHR